MRVLFPSFPLLRMWSRVRPGGRTLASKRAGTPVWVSQDGIRAIRHGWARAACFRGFCGAACVVDQRVPENDPGAARWATPRFKTRRYAGLGVMTRYPCDSAWLGPGGLLPWRLCYTRVPGSPRVLLGTAIRTSTPGWVFQDARGQFGGDGLGRPGSVKRSARPKATAPQPQRRFVAVTNATPQDAVKTRCRVYAY